METYTGFTLYVYDEKKQPFYAKIGVKNGVGETVRVVYCNRCVHLSLPPDVYQLRVTHGKLYAAHTQWVDLRDARGINGACDTSDRERRLDIILTPKVDPLALGWVAFDAHSHVSRDESLDTGDLARASAIMRAEGFHAFFAGSPYDHATHLEYLANAYPDPRAYRTRFASVLAGVNDGGFLLDIGNEIVKGRYGHVYMAGYTQFPPFSRYYDEEYDRWQFLRVGEEPPYSLLPIHEAVRMTLETNESVDAGSFETALVDTALVDTDTVAGVAFAAAAHPTSWWRSESGAFITNIAATLAFDLLTESVQAMTVMGYQADHPHYQGLWYEALNSGYRVTGLAETDAAFDRVPPHHFLSYKTYAYTQGLPLTARAICAAVRAGRCMVSSGPLIMLRVSGADIGDILPFASDEPYKAEVKAYACDEGELKRVVLIANGEVVHSWDAEGNYFADSASITMNAEGFILAKCYDKAGNVAFTNPVYIRNRPFVNRNYHARVRVDVWVDGQPASGVYYVGEPLPELPPELPSSNMREVRAFSGVIETTYKPALPLTIVADGEGKSAKIVKTVRLFETAALQGIFRNLYLGTFCDSGTYESGEVPAALFGLTLVRALLDDMRLTVDMSSLSS